MSFLLKKPLKVIKIVQSTLYKTLRIRYINQIKKVKFKTINWIKLPFKIFCKRS